ncbi:MAG: zinc ribbon domain-containing protein [Anaerolineales bacterium]|nr:zinc ribbon domain-containing protein [Anaerolineales bacterium]
MVKKTLGYVQLEWTCPNCNTRNPGLTKTCETCGAPQPENVKFEQPAEQKFIIDEKDLQAAKSGADIHCGFCGTRNPATAAVCSQCGGDLKEGKARQAGREMGPPPAAPKVVTCTKCGSENPGSKRVCSQCGAPLPRAERSTPAMATGVRQQTIDKQGATPAKKKPNWLLIGGIGAAFLACCLAMLFLFVFPSVSVQATVTDVQWQTSVPVQEIRPVDYSDERGSAPSDAYNISCHDDSREICENKTIDQGNGVAEVVQECHTETDTYCSYTVDEWSTIQTYTLDGSDLNPVYSEPSLTGDQRLGSTSEDLTVYFDTSKGQKTYSPGSVSEFQQFQVGSTWTLKMNAVGGVLSVER